MAAAAETFTGLSAAEVAERVRNGETNEFVQPTSRSAWSIIRANTFTLFNAIIIGCFAVLLVIGRWQDSLFGFTAIFNAGIGSFQEFRAKRSLDRLALINAPRARVLRDGTEKEIPIGSVVLDDLMVLRAGDQVTADSMVVSARGLQADESMLTGESDAVDKDVGANVLSGSIIVAGSGYASATKVGADSYANSFAAEARRFSLVHSELRNSINRVLKWITWVIGPVALLVLYSQISTQGGWSEAASGDGWQIAAVATIASIVSMIPLGLVLMTSIAFAVGAVRLSAQNVLIQELAAVEGLARVDLICLDKTGTLTEGEIVFDEAHVLEAEGAPGWEQVLAWYGVQPEANATAQCLAERFVKQPVSCVAASIDFSSARKWSAIAFDGSLAGSWVLGAPEMVFPAMTTLPPDVDGTGFSSRVSALASEGLRTLVLAHSPHALDTDNETLPRELAAVTLLTFTERVRADAAETLSYFADQGVSVRVISGDNPETVSAIARRLGLDAPQGFDARELPEGDDELAEVLETNLVFGRVTPEQKKRIVLSLKRVGHTVAMTGDGVNDALAMKEADIGIAMGSGSAATKAVARIILIDGKFSHLPRVVGEGRRVIANIERVSMLFLTKTAWAFGLAVVFGALLLPFPFLPRQLSAIDGLTIGLPAFFLALMPNVQRYQPGFLKRSLSFAIPAGVVVTVTLAVFVSVATGGGIPLDEIRTGATLVLTVIGLWILVVLSRPVTVLKALVIGAMMIGLVLVYAIPIVANFLQLVDPSLTTALMVVMASALSIGAIECVRFAHLGFVRRLARQSIGQPGPTT